MIIILLIRITKKEMTKALLMRLLGKYCLLELQKWFSSHKKKSLVNGYSEAIY